MKPLFHTDYTRLCHIVSHCVTFHVDEILSGDIILDSIPAKPLVQTTLKCGGFFIAPMRS